MNTLNNIVYIGLGSNKGDRMKFLQLAVNKLAENKKIMIEKISPVYESRPFGSVEQNKFLNAAVKLRTNFSPEDLLKLLKQTEDDIGRVNNVKWGPREIDIDLLFYNSLILSDEFISLPHKGVIYRDFVLKPLTDIEPELIHPVHKKKLSSILLQVTERYIVKKLPEKLLIQELYN